MKLPETERAWSQWPSSDKRPQKGAGLYGEVPIFAPVEQRRFDTKGADEGQAPRA